jgi:hypothetical protein
MTFLFPPDLSAEAAQELSRACVAGGPDSMPWPTRVKIESGRLTVQRDVEESGFLVVPWEVNGSGLLMGTTATLMERPLAYHLPVELARGKVNQLRCQAADWQAGGLQIHPDLEQNIRKVGVHFGQAATEQSAEHQFGRARAVLELSHQAAEALTQQYVAQVFKVRHEREPRLSADLGCRLVGRVPLERLDELSASCNSVCIPFSWSAIEPGEGSYSCQHIDSLLSWAESKGLAVTAGPVIDFSGPQLPDWLWLYERDIQSLRKFMATYLANMLKRYRRRIRRWQLTSASNGAAILSLGEEELLWLTVNMVQVARQIDPELELVVGISQPWGEYMAVEERSHSPFIFADTLVRSELNLSALDLEIVMGVTPRGSYCRDLLDTSRLLDLYALLGVPLRVTLGFPSGNAADANAEPELKVGAGRWHSQYSASIQAEWATSFTSLALCKPYVQAVHWTQFSDETAHLFPHCGLLDTQGRAKPSLRQLQILREAHLR